MASWKIVRDDEKRLLKASAEGMINKDDYYSASEEARILSDKLGYNILWDLRKAVLNTNLADVYFLPKEVEIMTSRQNRMIKVAGIVKPDEFETWKTIETFLVNVGLQARVYLSEKEVMDWLSNDE